MCRIAGFRDFNYRGNYDFENTIVNMRDVLAYGGPDDCGVYTDKEQGVALGHRRLSIIDLSERGHQPMPNSDKSLWITYNGEVYNFPEIRKGLEAKGYKFISNSDTEVILKAYEEWGMEAVHKFRGMFALALWDKKKGKLIICRDRVGVKPLYYYSKDGLFMFASELKSFHKHPKFIKELDEAGLSLYLQFGYICAPNSIFKYVRKLNPGCYLEVDNSGQIKEVSYWDLENYYQEGSLLEQNKYFDRMRQEDIAVQLEGILLDSFKLRLISDVPVGVFLSGGIDSSLVAALIQKNINYPLRTFTIGFEESKYNEANWAKQVADYLGTAHTELYCTYKDALNVIPQLPEIYDEPFGDSSAIPTFLLSNLARKQVKVCLSGDGGDEFFCGYPKYWCIRDRLNKISQLPFVGRLANLFSPRLVSGAFKRVFPNCQNLQDKYRKMQWALNTRDFLEQSNLAGRIFFDEDLDQLNIGRQDIPLKIKKGYDPINAMMLFDAKSYLADDILVKVDRAAMAVALEAREPLLDHTILEYIAKTPVGYKYRNRESKYILRKILYKYVPKNLVDRPKKGFSVPIYEWFKTDLKNYYMNYLDKAKIEKEGIFNSAAVESLLQQCLSGAGISHNRLWLLLNFELWKEKWM